MGFSGSREGSPLKHLSPALGLSREGSPAKYQDSILTPTQTNQDPPPSLRDIMNEEMALEASRLEYVSSLIKLLRETEMLLYNFKVLTDYM